jgi:gas vesicle protein
MAATLLALPACEQRQTTTEKVKDKASDALDQRPAEKVKDAAEDTKDALKNASKEIKDAVKNATE